MKITKREYIRAQRIVTAYEAQQAEGKYQFLYYDSDDMGDDPKEACIKAPDLISACELFMQQYSDKIQRVDYEVFFKGQYLDITDVVCINKYL